MAVNTVDGSSLWDFAFDLQLLATGDPVRQANEAHAYASCTLCVTGAVSFQVLLIVGQADEIIPLNAGVAANYQCVRCRTYALAFQIVASLLEAPDPGIQEELDAVMRRLGELEANAGSLSAEDVLRALVQARQDFLLALEPIIAVERGSTDVEGTEEPKGIGDPSAEDDTASSDGGSDRDDDGTSEPEGDRSTTRDEDVSEPENGAHADQEGDATAPDANENVAEPTREPSAEGGVAEGGTEGGSSTEQATVPEDCGPEAQEASAEACPEDADLMDSGEPAEEPPAH